MGKRRTKIEKVKAQLVRLKAENTISKQNSSPTQTITYKPEMHNKSLNIGTFYSPNLQLPLELLKKDLTKTLIVTILAIIVQISLAYYLNHGGWNLVNTVIISKLVNFG